jgi:four helix bundle protein
MRDFRKLNVWERAHRLTLDLYKATRRFPKEELYGLTSQIRRSAASICANLAEGCGRTGEKEFRRFLFIALGSASELEYHLLLAADLGNLERSAYARMDTEVTGVKRMIAGLLKRLKADGRQPSADSR